MRNYLIYFKFVVAPIIEEVEMFFKNVNVNSKLKTKN